MNAARIRAIAIVGTLAIAAVVVTKLAISDDKQQKVSYADSCPSGTVQVVTKPLPNPDQITIKVYNGAVKRPGLAKNVADQLRHRGFKVEAVHAHDDRPTLDDVASISYGPKTVGAAWVLRAYFLNGMSDSNVKFDIKSTSNVVVLVLGNRFQQLGAPTEVNQAIAVLGNPTPPPGTCSTTPTGG